MCPRPRCLILPCLLPPLSYTPRKDPLPSAGSRVTGGRGPDWLENSQRPAARRSPEACAEVTAARAALSTGARGHTRGPDLRGSGADESQGEGPSPPPPVSWRRLSPLPESFLGSAARPGSGGEPRAGSWRLSPATPTLAALAPLQHRSVSRALLALKVGLEYFNRAIKRMLTYICQEIHL